MFEFIILENLFAKQRKNKNSRSRDYSQTLFSILFIDLVNVNNTLRYNKNAILNSNSYITYS